MRVGFRQRRTRRQYRLGAVDALRRVVSVGQTGQVQELLDLVVPGCGDKLLDVFRQPAPTREPVLAGDHELGIGKHRERLGTRMMPLDACANAVGIVAVQAQKLLGLLLDAGQTWPRW